MMDLGKRINLFKRPNYVDTDNTFHNTNFTTLNAALSSYQALLPCATHSEVWSCVWMGNSGKSTFLRLLLISEISNFGAAMIIQVFQLYLLNCQESCFFVPSGKYSPFTSLGTLLGSSMLFKRPLFHTMPCKYLVHQTTCFVVSYFFGGRNEYPWTFLAIKTPKSLIAGISASWITSTMQDILLQKSSELETEGRKSFT